MSRSLNKVQLIGHIGRDIELRYTDAGTAVANVSLATNERFKNGEEWEDRTEWHNLTFWGRNAENVEEYCGKGSRIYVEGRNQTRSWEDEEKGVTRYKTEVVVRDFIMLDGRNDSDDDEEDERPKRKKQSRSTKSKSSSQRKQSTSSNGASKKKKRRQPPPPPPEEEDYEDEYEEDDDDDDIPF